MSRHIREDELDAATLREAMTPTQITLARAQELLPHVEK